MAQALRTARPDAARSDAARSRANRPSAHDIRSLMIGRGHGGLSVVRQAWRVRPVDTDELVQVRRGPDYWIASRLADRITIWACHDVFAADEKFEQLAEASEGWVEARPPEALRAG